METAKCTFFFLYFFFLAGEGCRADASGCWEWVPAGTTPGWAVGQLCLLSPAPARLETSLAGQSVVSSHKEKGFMGHLETLILR